jgi:hypothetical protein
MYVNIGSGSLPVTKTSKNTAEGMYQSSFDRTEVINPSGQGQMNQAT